VYAAPLINLLLATPQVRAAKEWVVRRVFRRHDYVATKNLAREVCGIIMMLQLPIILGFAVPIITPLACLGVALNACMFHSAVAHLEIQLTDESQASITYLWISFGIGYGLVAWLFLESELHGMWLVVVGVPVCTTFVMVMPWTKWNQGARSVLEEPLLAEEDDSLTVCSSTTSLGPSPTSRKEGQGFSLDCL